MSLRFAPTEKIQEGFRLPGALRDKQGRVLAAAGTVLTSSILQTLGTRRLTGLYVGDDWKEKDSPAVKAPAKADARAPVPAPAIETATAMPASLNELRPVSVENLRSGMVLSQDIFDQSGVLLLARSSKITPRFLQLLRERRIGFVTVKPGGADSSPAAATLDRLLESGQGDQFDLGGRSPLERRRLQPAEFWGAARQSVANHRNTATTLEGMCTSLIGGSSIDSAGMLHLVNDFMTTLTLDSDLLPLVVGLQQSGDEYLFDHCVSTALLSMTIAAQLGLSQEQIRCIGLSAVFHDIGMLRVPADIRLARRPLTAAEVKEAQRHPYYTLEILEAVRSFPREGSYIAYQVHERLNAGGYPKGRQAALIQPYARIVSVADSFVAMTKPRPFRAAKPAHEAVKELLVAGHDNHFDRTVLRALLDAVSAFPVGSRVELTQGVTGMVVRANPGQHTRPVIMQLDGQGKPTDRIIDLLQTDEMQVVRALPSQAG